MGWWNNGMVGWWDNGITGWWDNPCVLDGGWWVVGGRYRMRG